MQLTAAKGLAPLRRSPVFVGVLGVLFSHSGPDALLRAGSPAHQGTNQFLWDKRL